MADIARRRVLGWLSGFALFVAKAQADQESKTDTNVDEPVYELTEATRPPRPTRMQKPEYNDRTRRAAIEGTVVLRCIVTSSGVAKRIVVVEGLHEDLDKASIEALKSWRFAPAIKGDKPVAVWFVVEFTFRVL
jgi:TonB family protein